jgi:hypothetical protein
MPYKPKRDKRRVTGHCTLTADQLGHIITGFALDGPEPRLGGRDRHGYEMPFADDAHRRQCWVENREFILGLEGVTVDDPMYFWRGNSGVYFNATTEISAYRDYELEVEKQHGAEETSEGTIETSPLSEMR